MKIKKLDDYEKYKLQQDPPGRDYSQSWVSYRDIEPYVRGRVLDIGCKSGILVNELLKRGHNACGIDIGNGCVDVWNRTIDAYYKRNLICGDFIKYRFSSYFSFIVMSHVLEHFYDPEFAMEKVYRILRNNGQVYCTFPINEHYGAHYFTFEDESEIVPWFNKFGFFVRILGVEKKDYPIYKVLLKK